MHRFKRLLAASGAAGLLIGFTGATQAFATAAFTATLAQACVTSGGSQTITVTSNAGSAAVHIEVAIDGSMTNAGAQTATGITDDADTFTYSWAVGPFTTAATAQVRVWVLTTTGVAVGVRNFEIHPVSSPCPSPGPDTFYGQFADVSSAGGDVQKTCDAGLTGTASFTVTIKLDLAEASTKFSLPASVTLNLTCNGKSLPLPQLPIGSVITLHEATPPVGAAAAADTEITIKAQPPTTTIHNAKAAVVTTPTPTPTAVVLPATGHPSNPLTLPWSAMALVGLIALGSAALMLRRRS
jgi:hypothetical protein